ncbi:MAG: hydroxymethylbilane synthase [Rubripirellula sp.]
MKPQRIATRKSPLAIWQAEHVAARLQDHGFETELVPLVSGGDTDMRPIDGTRQVGVFTKRIQQALLDQEADIAVHSLKDLPTEVDERLVLGAVPERETVADSLVSAERWTLETLPQGARIGTGSRRRGAQLLSRRPDLQVLPIRGNVQTRLAKLEDGEYDAILLAEAGVVRLEMHDLPRTQFPLEEMLPAPGQGALGIEVRADDASLEVVAVLDDTETRASVVAERTLLASLHGGCLAPIAALATVKENVLRLDAVVLSHDGAIRLDEHQEVAFDSEDGMQAAVAAAKAASESLISRGAADLIESQR